MEKSLSHSKPLALITGASSGIGEVFARELAQAGYDLLLVARREDKLRKLQGEIGGEILVADLATALGMEAVVKRIEAANNLDFLVNNAGFGTKGRFWQAAEQDKMHSLHVLATVRVTRAALPRMVQRNRGSVVNVSSVAAFSPSLGNVSYCATKAWMNDFTEGLWLELQNMNSAVQVQALCPGFTRSEFHDAAGIDKTGIPESLWTSAEDVVKASLRGLARRDLIVVPGWRYQAWVTLQKLLPRSLVLRISAKAHGEFRKTNNG